MIPKKDTSKRGLRLGQDPRRNGTKISDADIKRQIAEIENEITRLAGATRNIAFCDAVSLLEKKIKASPIEVRYGTSNLKLVVALVKEAKSVRNTASTSTTTTTPTPPRPTPPPPRPTPPPPRPTYTPPPPQPRPVPRPQPKIVGRPPVKQKPRDLLNGWMIVCLIIEAVFIVGAFVTSVVFPEAFGWLLGLAVGGFLLILAGFEAERGMLGLRGSSYYPDWYVWYNEHVFIILPIVNVITTIVMFSSVGILSSAVITALCAIVATLASGMPKISLKNMSGDDFIPGMTSVVTLIGAMCLSIYCQNDIVTWISLLVSAAVFVGTCLRQQAVYNRMDEEWYFPFLYIPSYILTALSITSLYIDEQMYYIAAAIAWVIIATGINRRLLEEYATSNISSAFSEKASYVIAIAGNIISVVSMFIAAMDDTEQSYIFAVIVVAGTLVSSIISAAGEDGDAISAISIIVSDLILLYTMHLTGVYFDEYGVMFVAGLIFAVAYIYAGKRFVGFSNADYMNSEVFSFDLFMDGGKVIVVVGAILQAILTFVTYINSLWQPSAPFCIIGIAVVNCGLIWYDDESELPVKLGGLISSIVIIAINIGWILPYFA